MGLLDDAIREHLDLKRRLGAEEDELARLEGEENDPLRRLLPSLGPMRATTSQKVHCVARRRSRTMT